VGDSWEKIILVFNGQKKPVSIPLPEGKYRVVAKQDDINEKGIGESISDEVEVEGISMVILVSVS
jgi:pullulanase